MPSAESGTHTPTLPSAPAAAAARLRAALEGLAASALINTLFSLLEVWDSRSSGVVLGITGGFQSKSSCL